MDVGVALVGRMSVRLERVMCFRRSPSGESGRGWGPLMSRHRLSWKPCPSSRPIRRLEVMLGCPKLEEALVTVVTVRISRPAN